MRKSSEKTLETYYENHGHTQYRRNHDEESCAEEEEKADSFPQCRLKWQNNWSRDGHDTYIGNNVHDESRYHIEEGLRLADGWYRLGLAQGGIFTWNSTYILDQDTQPTCDCTDGMHKIG